MLYDIDLLPSYNTLNYGQPKNSNKCTKLMEINHNKKNYKSKSGWIFTKKSLLQMVTYLIFHETVIKIKQE